LITGAAPPLGQAPRYVLLAEALAADIRSGRHPIGTALPTEHALVERHRVSRHTVREALRLLRAQGMVESRHGRGTYVARPTAQADFHLASSIDELFTVHERTRLVELEVAELTASADLARALRCRPGEAFLHVDAVRELQENGRARPISALELYIPQAFAAVLDDIREGTGAVSRMLERRFGRRLMELEQSIRATLLPARAALRLGVEPGSPGLDVRRRFIGEGGEALMYSLNLHPRDFTLALHLRRQG
jgi:GntR family transcriptional regulator